jgi:hypothetical protein
MDIESEGMDIESESMDIESEIKIVLLLGTVVGFFVILLSNITVLPASYMMNKYIHHNVIMRWMMCVVGTIFGLFVIVYAFIMSVVFRKTEYYYGLFPSYIPMGLTQNGGDVPVQTVGPAESWLSRVYDVILQMSSPFSILTDVITIENFTLEDSNAYRAYRDHIKNIYQGDLNAPRFDVDLMERVKEAGKKYSLDEWSGAMRVLEPECGKLFAPA